MRIGIPNESGKGQALVAASPDTVKKLKIGARGKFGDAITFRFYRNGREIAHDQFTKPFAPPPTRKLFAATTKPLVPVAAARWNCPSFVRSSCSWTRPV